MAKPAEAETPTISFPYAITIQIEVTASDVMQIQLNGSSGPVNVTLQEDNAGAQIAAITVVTYSGDAWTTPLILDGEDADLFTLTNGAVDPCDLVVGATSIQAGDYAIILRAPPPREVA